MPDPSSLVPDLLTVTGAGVWGLLLSAGVVRGWTALCERTRHDVTGRWIVVTGCDSGFGRGVVGELVDHGARVVAMCLTPEGAREALARGADLAPCLDLTDDAAVIAAAQAVEDACGGSLWGLVHNAEIVLPGFVEYQPISFYRRVMDVNFFAPGAAHTAAPPVSSSGQGKGHPGQQRGWAGQPAGKRAL